MNRREFLGSSFIGAASVAASSTASAQVEGEKGIKAAVITNKSGAHLEAYYTGLAKAPEVASVILSDPDGTAEARAREILGEKLTVVSKDRNALLAAEQPEFAVITMEAVQAPEAIRAALEAGCHVLAEKPACVSAEDFAPLAALAESKKLNLCLALANRLNPEVLKAREFMAAGTIGKMYGIETRFVEDQTRLTRPEYHASWFADKARAGGGHVTWLGIHWLDLSMHITGASITHVAGFTTNIGGQPINIEDSAALSLRYDNGALGTMTSGYYRKSDDESLIRIWGSKGWMELSSENRRRVRWQVTEGEGGPVEEYIGPSDHVHYTVYTGACVRAAAGLGEPPMTPAECLRVLRVIYGLYEAAETGTTVVVAPT